MPFQFTENAVATRPTCCERLSYKTIIQSGQPCLAAKDITGHVKFVCAPCHAYYNEKAAKAKVGNKAAEVPLLDFQAMRHNVKNHRDKRLLGGHTPGGHVTALPIVAKVSQQRYRSENSLAGYSENHSQHARQQSIWSQRAYKGFNANQVGMLTINLLVYVPTYTKGQPTIVDGIKEDVCISSDITARALSKLIREILLPALVEFCGPVFFNIDDMVLRNTSNNRWTRVDETSDEPYFGTNFLKFNPHKKDGGLVFSIPTTMKPPVFRLVFLTGPQKHSSQNRAEIQINQIYSPVRGSFTFLKKF
ncbi:hypothetical protein BJ912DRAFT_930230 [Pholiota molesta]|nr:hypothetical protein BJ912DRAFT_930230 [Pholiota molesta]